MPEKRRPRHARLRNRRTPKVAPAGEKVYYSVQDRADLERLVAGGEPWPSDSMRALLGPGFYCWPRLRQAEKYKRLLVSRGVRDLQIVRYAIRRSDLRTVRTLDLRRMSDEDLEVWMQTYSEYTDSPPPRRHGFDCVIRETAIVGTEHQFSPDTFRRFFRGLPD